MRKTQPGAAPQTPPTPEPFDPKEMTITFGRGYNIDRINSDLRNNPSSYLSRGFLDINDDLQRQLISRTGDTESNQRMLTNKKEREDLLRSIAKDDPKYRGLVNQYFMGEEADAFREGLPDYIRDRQQTLTDTFRLAEDEGVRRTRENFGGRGLLYSGMAQAGEAGLKGELANQLASGKAAISSESENLARKKEYAAAAAGLEEAAKLMDSAEQYYNLSMQNDLLRRRNMTNLIKGVGYGVGAYYGSQEEEPKEDEITDGV